MKILIVSECPTHPTTAGNRQWILAQAERLKRKGHDIHFLFVYVPPLHRALRVNALKDIEATKKYWMENYHQFTVSHARKYLMLGYKLYRDIFCNGHYKVDDQYPFGLEESVNNLDSLYHFDVCIINYYYLSRLFKYIKIPKKAISTHDAFAYKDIKIGMPTLCITADTEAKAMQRCPHIFALQTMEADYFQILSPQSKVYNFFGEFKFYRQPMVSNHDIVFLSGGNIFNQNGLSWFLKDVFHLIRKRFPDARLLVGGGICKAMPSLGGYDGVVVQGYVSDPFSFYAQADICINPCYQGTGLKIKTFESISYDKLTMVHPHSTEGIFDKENAPLFVSDNPEEWVNFLDKVWNHPSEILTVKNKNEKYIDNMRLFVENEYNRFLES